MNSKYIHIQGHRGARGLYPENTITAFIEAVKLGVDTLEMDVVITGDGQVLVSHEAWMNPDFCWKPDGTAIERGSTQKYNLYKMDYEMIKQFDCGKNGHPEFPFQKKMRAFKPLLRQVFDEVEKFTEINAFQKINYNIEIKTEPGEYLFNPSPEIFVDLLFKEVAKKNLFQRTSLQSFDLDILREVRRKTQPVKTGLLVETQSTLSENIEALGFIPDSYSPEFNFVTPELIAEAHRMGMQLIPWTVNVITDMQRLIDMGVDGIITDYPDRAISIIKRIS